MVAGGGAAGAALRYHLARLLGGGASGTAAPLFAAGGATLAINTLGSLLMGVLAGWLARQGVAGDSPANGWRLLGGVGLLGGFTTFSAFSLEGVALIERGQLAAALAYAFGSVALGWTGLWLGLNLWRTAT